MAKTILVTGGSGFIGSNFLFFATGKRVIKSSELIDSSILGYTIISPNHKKCDITEKGSVESIFKNCLPDVVINFAAYRDANTAEKQRGDRHGSVWKSNVLGVENLYKISKKYGTYLIHISTDMVFSGKPSYPGPYDEATKPEKYLRNLSWYGWTKAEGERKILNKKNTAIIRIGNVTQPIYDPKVDYVGKILYLFDQEKLYPLFSDQFLSLSSIPDLFEIISKLIKMRMEGVFHASSSNLFTPYKLGKYLIKKTRGNNYILKQVSIDKYLLKRRNRYPKYGGLLSNITSKKLKTKFVSWEEFIDLCATPHFKK